MIFYTGYESPKEAFALICFIIVCHSIAVSMKVFQNFWSESTNGLFKLIRRFLTFL